MNTIDNYNFVGNLLNEKEIKENVKKSEESKRQNHSCSKGKSISLPI